MNDKQQPYNGQIDEALLTAFALDQLDGPERALVEAALKTDHKAQSAVEEIRTVASHLRDAVTHDEQFAPSASLRQLIEQRLEGIAAVDGDCPNFRLSENGTVPFSPSTAKVSRRRRWALLAVAAAAVLLLAVTIPSLFPLGITSDVAMQMPTPEASVDTQADSMANGELATDGARDEFAAMAEPEEAAEMAGEPSRIVGKMAGDYMGKDAGSRPAKPSDEMRSTPARDGAVAKSAAGPAESESEFLFSGATTGTEAKSSPPMKGSAAYDRPSEPAYQAGQNAAGSEAVSDSVAPIGDSLRRGMAKPAISKPAAPAPAWSPSQAAGPGAIPVPYPTVQPAPNDLVPLQQSPAMPRAKSAGSVANPYSAPASDSPPATQTATPMAIQTAPQQQIELQGQTEGEPARQSGGVDFRAMGGRLAEKKPQASQPMYDPTAGPGYGQGMGGGMGGMGGYGMGPARPQGEELDFGPTPPSTPAAPAQVQLTPGITTGKSESATAGLAFEGRQPEMKQAWPGAYGGASSGRGGEQAESEEMPGAYYSESTRIARGRELFQRLDLGTEQYAPVVENPFQSPVTEPESTVSADVDTGSYPNVRRFLENNQPPPPGAVRVEEMVNYFAYNYPQPKDDTPFSVDMETASCPWNQSHRLARIGLKAKEIDPAERGPSNLVFLLDVSGSMRDANKLPLVKDAMAMLVDQLTEDDRVSIVTYAGEAGLALEPTEGTRREKIMERIEALKAGGSTHGSAGIQMAYDQAMANFVPGGNNRVILCTDGDLNVGITDDNELVKLIQEKASSGVFLTVVGFGTGNLKDAKLEQLADKGNGKYAYVDGVREAKKVFVEQASGSLVTVAKDVKIQIEFNPAKVQSYRLIGYENRLLATQDFNDDMKDAGDIGAGHSVTFLYEIVPTNLPVGQLAVVNNALPNLRYQRIMSNALTEAAESGELLALKLRYKLPDEQQSRLLELPMMDSGKRFGEASSEFRFAASVAAFGMLLRGSQYNQGLTFSAVEEFAAGAADNDPQGRRGEFVDLVRRARSLYGDTTQVGADANMLPRAAAEMAPAAAEQAPAPPE